MMLLEKHLYFKFVLKSKNQKYCPMLKVLTSYTFGLTAATATTCLVCCSNTKHPWLLGGVSGLCTFGTFLLFRRWGRPLAYQSGYSKLDQIKTAHDWRSALSVISDIMDAMDATRHSRTGFIQTHSHFTNLLLLITAESVLKSSRKSRVHSIHFLGANDDVLTYCKYANAAYGVSVLIPEFEIYSLVSI